MSGVDDASITGSTTFATPIASNSINFCCISIWIVSVCFSLRKSVLAEWRRNPESRLFLCSVYAGGRVPTPRFWGRWGVKHLKFAKFPPHSVLLEHFSCKVGSKIILGQGTGKLASCRASPILLYFPRFTDPTVCIATLPHTKKRDQMFFSLKI